MITTTTPTKATAARRAHAMRTLATACADLRPAAAAILRKTADDIASGSAVLTGPLAVSLREAGLDAISAMAAVRLCR